MLVVDDFTTLNRRLSDRGALVAAAVLPGLPDGEILARLHQRWECEGPDDTEAFKQMCPTIGGTRLRRVEFDGETSTDECAELTPSPHGIRSYSIRRDNYDGFLIGDDPDFDDTDQSFLSDFGFAPSPVDAVHRGVSRTDDTFERKPIFPY